MTENPTIQEPHPLWSKFDESEGPPPELYVTFYKGVSGHWIFSTPAFYPEHAEKLGDILDRPVKILKYKLVEVTVPEKRQEVRVRKPKTKSQPEQKSLFEESQPTKRIRMPRQP